MKSRTNHTLQKILFSALLLLVGLTRISLLFSNAGAETLEPSNDEYENLIADFTFSPNNPFAGMIITFNASSSYPVESIASYDWDFGDGSNGIGRVITHTYYRPGRYVVILTVKDNLNRTVSCRKELSIPDIAENISRIMNVLDTLGKTNEKLTRDISYITDSFCLIQKMFYILEFVITILIFLVVFSVWYLQRKDRLNENHIVVLQRKISEFEESLKLAPPPPEDERVYNEFVGNLDVFEALASLTGKTREELYSIYKNYRLREYDGKTPPLESFLLNIRASYKLDFVRVLEGQKPLGLIVTGSEKKKIPESVLKNITQAEFFLIHSILDETLVSQDIIKRAKALKINCLVDLTYVNKPGIPEVQLGSRDPAVMQQIDQIILKLGDQGIYVKKADERFLGSYLIKEAEKHGIRGIQLTFIGYFSEGDFSELLMRILDTISSVFSEGRF